MPPEVLLVLASSGITLVASLMFFVSNERPPPVVEGPSVAFCLPPARKNPPPLPVMPECAVDLSTSSLHSVMTFKPMGDEWVVTLDTTPIKDVPALQVTEDGDGVGQVNDLRWHGRAGVARSTHRTWKQKPGRA
ncbi:MAG: hypothetical protein JNM17_02280 [Archangium sp.]|nr:hypothetical protein [Archangium sp.]